MLLKELRIKHDEEKYAEFLTKVEKIKFEMAERYRMHPSNYVKKKDDVTRNNHLSSHHIGSDTTLVDDLGWDDRRIDIIGQNSNEGLHYVVG